MASEYFVLCIYFVQETGIEENNSIELNWEFGTRNLGYNSDSYPPDYGLPIIHENSVSLLPFVLLPIIIIIIYILAVSVSDWGNTEYLICFIFIFYFYFYVLVGKLRELREEFSN
jgi:hypothetical protein